MHTVLTPIGRVALAALHAFGVTDAANATAALNIWPRRAELTPTDIAAIVSSYRPTGDDQAASDTQPVGIMRISTPELPELTGCELPSAVRIEIYADRTGDGPDSLDASAYACPKHIAPIMAKLTRAGYYPVQVPGPLDIYRTCGYVYRYPTAGGAA
ncbi:hypothetical protein AB0F93_03265 [Micromonospora tulbaghiae]|uniref:hypothetical protein n=1 Tax=Micromonospora TaxID=1873 RepID=UPI0008294963|nr:hypothetical protein [Micromonospora aurantiaca]SCL40085.1 hypothetical protein GA0070615_4271 [Micromonospora aurantiaca]